MNSAASQNISFLKNTRDLFYSVIWILLFTGMILQSCGVDKPEEILQAEKQLPARLDYNLHVKPVLSDKCFACHGPDEASLEAGLELASKENALAPLKDNPGRHAIVPGNLAKSEVYHKIIADDPEERMPPVESNLALTAYEKAVLIRWIEQGAEYKPHWAFIKAEKHPLPEGKNNTWPKNPIDHFVLERLEKEGLKPAKEADRETLIRRVSLDLTGLPPTVVEVDAFLADDAPNAYEKVVDRLLSSPHYGEQMATAWMDVARYADTHGYTVDRYRDMSPWRDWVIKAFNRNMPFDEFTTWQMAGDLLPDATAEQKLATGFNRNHAQNMEGGIVNEEFRVEYVADRTNTLGTAFLGLTVGCARCHDHKYDPISQKEYYQLFAFFNNIDEAGQISWDNAMPVPTLLLSDEKQDSLISFLDEKIKDTQKQLSQTKQQQQENFEKWYAHQHQSGSHSTVKGLQAHFTLDRLQDDAFKNAVSPKNKGVLADPVLVAGKSGKAVQLNGDEALDLGSTGIFSRANPFSIGLWVNIPEDMTTGVIFHKGQGAILYDFRGYHLALRDSRLEVLMAHTWPYNNIIKLSADKPAKKEWLHLLLTYDGSSKAKGLKLYMNGQLMKMETQKDKLYKDILFPALEKEPGLQIGARMRGVGFKKGLVDDIMVFDRELTAVEAAQLAGASTATPHEKQAYLPYYLAYFSASYQRQLKELQKLRLKKNQVIEQVQEVMVMDELEEKRAAYLLERGAYDAHGEEVEPATPESILPFSDSLPQNRLGLAQWLMHPDHPLTARVMMNRYWQNYFGRGLVKTAADFGNQGDLPSHPKLLDWLAISFRESGWDIKAMQKLIVMSAAYRQSSYATAGQLEKDPENLLLSRGPAFRLTAEMLRDNALAASGLLVKRTGGPSVKPYQPEGLWKINGAEYVQDSGEKLYRRSLYTFWKRTVPPPTMNAFDAPDRSYCIVQRQQTNTPLQALVLLNDPQFTEAARVMAEKVSKQKKEVEEQLIHTFRLLTARTPQEKELAVLKELYQHEKDKFKAAPGKMKGWLSSGEHNVAPSQDPQAQAALTVVASTIMNSDAFITRR